MLCVICVTCVAVGCVICVWYDVCGVWYVRYHVVCDMVCAICGVWCGMRNDAC